MRSCWKWLIIHMYKYTGWLNESGRREICISPQPVGFSAVPVSWGLCQRFSAWNGLLVAISCCGGCCMGTPGTVRTWGRSQLRPHPSACHPHGQSQRATAVGQQQGVPQQRGWDSSPWPRFDTCSLVGYLNPFKRELTLSPIHQM